MTNATVLLPGWLSCPMPLTMNDNFATLSGHHVPPNHLNFSEAPQQWYMPHRDDNTTTINSSLDGNADDYDWQYNYEELLEDVSGSGAHSKTRYRVMRQIAYGYILPVILALGILGNSLNIAVFSQRRLWIRQDVMEKSAMIGLLSLAVADLLFCVIGFPSAFLKVRHFVGPEDYSSSAVLGLYYNTYRSSLLNIFMFMSTWFIITLSVERYLAVAHPFKAKRLITVQRTLLLRLMVVFVSVIINIPDFLRYNIQHVSCVPSTDTEGQDLLESDGLLNGAKAEPGSLQQTGCVGCYFTVPNTKLHGTATAALIYKVVWHSLGTFAPLIILTFCNVRLLAEIRKTAAYRRRRESRMSSSPGGRKPNNQPRAITVILILIVTLFLLLVCPSMLLTFLKDVLSDLEHVVHHYQLAVIVTNLCQAVNFSINFLLYCAFSPKFRRGLMTYSCTEPSVSTQSNEVVSRLI